jgi:dTMP kinase
MTDAVEGRFITFEGIEGSGKSTQIVRVASSLERTGRKVVTTREPGGTALGRRLRAALLDPSEVTLQPMVELLLYAADRAQHIAEVILPALERGEWVLCDRYLDATLAYQGYARGIGIEVVLELHSRPPLDLRPYRTILLDLDPRDGLARARRRNAEGGTGVTEGRFENESLEFHRRVRDGYLALARDEPGRFRIVDASGEADAVAGRIEQALADLVVAGEHLSP